MTPWIAVAYELGPARIPGFCIAMVHGVIGKVPIHHIQQQTKPAPEKSDTL